MQYDVAIIGCGIVGAAAAYELGKYDLNVLVLEAENDVAVGTTKANSAILHAGYDPEPGSLMARLNVEGVGLAKELCEKLDIPRRECGSLVLAFSAEDEAHIKQLYERGVKNGVPDLQILDREAVLAMEPNLSDAVIAALYAPTAAIVSPWEYCIALAETAVKNGVTLQRNAAVTAIEKAEGGYRLTTTAGVFEAKTVLNAAGVHSDSVHNMVAEPSFKIIPSKGEYYLLDKSEGGEVGCVIFQCPTKEGKGVLVSPTVHGNLIVGPNAETSPADDVSTTAAGLAYVADTARKSVPNVNLRQSIRNFSGVRAQTEVDEFRIGEVDDCPGFIDLAGIKSPGLTAAPAIAKEAVGLLTKHVELREKASYIDSRKVTRFKELNTEEKAALVAKNPAYGRVICRCETVTEGEILAAIHSPIPPCSVEGVKRRAGSGMGRCQGSFCGPRVLELLSRERESHRGNEGRKRPWLIMSLL
jgi:glycerol-3-phosphate dehydrogenase